MIEQNFVPMLVNTSQGSFKGPASYPTGGDPVTAKDFGLYTIAGATTFVGCTAGVPTHLGYLHTSGDKGAGANVNGIDTMKIVIIIISTGAQVANAVDLSAVVFTGVVFGK